MNPLAAIAAAWLSALNLTWRHARPGSCRSRVVCARGDGVSGMRLIDDSCNANPDSIIAALRVLASAPGAHAWYSATWRAEQRCRTPASPAG